MVSNKASFDSQSPMGNKVKKPQSTSPFKALAEECKLKPVTAINGVRAEKFSGLLSQPSPKPYWKTRHRGGSQDIFFLTTLDKIPDFTLEISKLAESCKYPSTPYKWFSHKRLPPCRLPLYRWYVPVSWPWARTCPCIVEITRFLDAPAFKSKGWSSA